MIVKAKDGATCPMEGRKRGRITDSEPVIVPDTAYYRRLVVEGSLIETNERETRDAKTIEPVNAKAPHTKEE